jgi:membrane dipeptidase
MQRLDYHDHRADPAGWARALGVSLEAIEIYLASEVIDLHIDSFIWKRLFGYDLHARHGHGLFGARFYSQVDLPRIREAQIGGATWIITTNPFRTGEDRRDTFGANVRQLRDELAKASADVAVVRNAREYRAARAEGKHGAFIGIQGGNALDHDARALDIIPDDLVLRITLVHLSSSRIGTTSSPLAHATGGDEGLSDFGKDFVKALNARKIFVDLAHIGRRGFFDAVAVHDKSQPLLVTHTGIDAVHQHWRNLTDPQLRAIADTGGTIGVMYQSSFLGDGPWNGKAISIVDHLAYIVRTVGDDFASLGSDWDGAIVPPRDMPTCLELPRLVQLMLDRGWQAERIQKILGGNFLRVVEALRG